MKSDIKTGIIKSLPITCSYFFVSMAFGIMMHEAGYEWLYSLIISVTVYSGAYQFLLVTFLSSGASLITVTLSILLLNSRQTFYSVTFLEDFKKMGRKLPFMIHTMTDETYAVNCTLDKDDPKRYNTMFWVAVFSWIAWIGGSVTGAVLGQVLPFDLTGIDFGMTALFVVIFIDQWEKTKAHIPAIVGAVVAIACLLIFGEAHFMLPSLLIVCAVLIVYQRRAPI